MNSSELMLQTCLCENESRVARLAKEWDRTVDIDKIDYRGMRLAPYFYHTLKKHGITSKHEKRLKILYQFWWLKTIFLEDQLRSACTELNENGISPLILKGGALIHYYEKPALRPMSDIDILVPREKFFQSVEILAIMGFSFEPQRLDFFKRHWKLVADFYHSMTLYNRQLKIEIDLHFRAGDFLSARTTRALFQGQIPSSTITGAFVPKLSHLVFITILHAVLSKNKDNLNWLLDIKILSNKMTFETWLEVAELAKKEKKTSLLFLGIRELRRFGLEPCPNLFDNPVDDNVDLCVFDHEVESNENKLSRWVRKARNTWISAKLIFPDTGAILKMRHFLRFARLQFLANRLLGNIPTCRQHCSGN